MVSVILLEVAFVTKGGQVKSATATLRLPVAAEARAWMASVPVSPNFKEHDVRCVMIRVLGHFASTRDSNVQVWMW